MSRAVALVATLSVLAACGTDPEPQFEADPTPAPTTSTPTAPSTPEPWEEKSDEGAIAFVEHWVDAFNDARASGATDELAALSTSGCETCSNFVVLTDRIYSDGGSLVTDGWAVTQVGDLPKTGRVTVVPISVRQAPQVLVQSSNAKPQRNPGGQVGMTATLRWTRTGWKMDRLDLVQ